MIKKSLVVFSLVTALVALPVASSNASALESNTPDTLIQSPINHGSGIEIQDVPVFPGGVIQWSNGQGFANFSSAYKQTRVLINNYSSSPVKYEVKLNGTTVISTKTLAGGQSIYETVTRPLFASGSSQYALRAFTSDSSARSVYVRAVGIE